MFCSLLPSSGDNASSIKLPTSQNRSAVHLHPSPTSPPLFLSQYLQLGDFGRRCVRKLWVLLIPQSNLCWMSPVHTKAFAAFGILHTSVKTDHLSSNRCQRGKLHRHGPIHSSSWYVTLCVRMCVSITGQPWWLLHSLLVAAKGSLLRSKAPPLPLSVCLFSCLVSPPCLVVTLSLSFAMPACLVSLQIAFYTTFSTPAETENVLCLLVSVWFFFF